MYYTQIPLIAASAVFQVTLACFAGFLLARRGVLDRRAGTALSRTIFMVMLPALLLAKVSASLRTETLLQWWALPAAAVFYAVTGALVGSAVARFSRTPAHQRPIVVSSVAFANAGYLPMTLIVAICSTASSFAADPTAADRGLAYVAVYVVLYSPMLWLCAYPYLAPPGHRAVPWQRLISPPLCAVLAAIAIALTPLRTLFHGTNAPLGGIIEVAELLGAGTIPCALLVVGANLANRPADPQRLPHRAIAAATAAKLLILPAIGIVTVRALAPILPDDPVFHLVLLIEAATPTAVNLVIMCQLHEHGEGDMAAVLLWQYLAAIPSLTLFIALYLAMLS